MSGPLRTQLANAHKFLSEALDKHDRMEYRPEIVDEQLDVTNLARLSKELQCLTIDFKKISKHMSSIEENNRLFSHLVIAEATSSATVKKEHAEYETFIEKHPYPDKLIVAQDKVAEIEVLMGAYQSLIDNLNKKIDLASQRLRRRSTSNSSQRSSNPSHSSSRGERASHSIKVKPLEMPKFTGIRREFPQFHNLFTIAIINNPKLTEAEKHVHLVACCEGEPLHMIKDYPPTDASFPICWGLLERRYKDEKQIIRDLYAILDKLQPANNNIKSLRATFDEISRTIRQLEGLGESVNQPRIVVDVKKKWPAAMIDRLEEAEEINKNWDIEKMLELLEKLISRKEHVQNIVDLRSSTMSPIHQDGPKFNKMRRSSQDLSMRPHPSQPDGFLHTSPNSAFLANTDQAPEDSQGRYSLDKGSGFECNYGTSAFIANPTSPPLFGYDAKRHRPCLFCGGAHFSSDCVAHKTIEARINQASKLIPPRCPRCLSSKHHLPCNRPLKCFHCSNNHHQCFCRKHIGEKFGQAAATSANPLFKKHPKDKNRGFNSSSYVVSGLHTDGHAHDEEEDDDYAVEHEQEANIDEENYFTDTYENEYEETQNFQALASEPDPPDVVINGVSRNELSYCTYLSCIRAQAVNPKIPELKAWATVMVDSGAVPHSWITDELADKLMLEGTAKEISVNTFNSDQPQKLKSRTVLVNLRQLDGSFYPIVLKTTRSIAARPIRTILTNLKPNFFNEQAIFLSPTEAVPQILIGQKHIHKISKSHEIRELPSGFHLTPTIFGDIISGDGLARDDHRDANSLVASVFHIAPECEKEFNDEDVLENPDLFRKMLEGFFSLEGLGIVDSPDENVDDLVYDDLMKNIRRDAEGRYEVFFPWKVKNPQLPTHKMLCLGRLKSLWKKLIAHPDLLEKYHQNLMDQLESGIIERVPKVPDGPVHYNPHHMILKESIDGQKLRIVNDASAGKESLNSYIHRGKVILPDGVGLQLRFRQKPVVATADIAKAFWQCSLKKSDRDSTRIIWLINPYLPPTPDNIVFFRSRFLPFGVSCSPTCLGCTIWKHLKENYSEYAQEIMDNCFVDNVFIFAECEAEAIEKCQMFRAIFLDAKMNLRDYMSNSQVVMAALDPSICASNNLMKILGVLWDAKMDVFILKIHNPKPKATLTKRYILANIAKQFDPMGLLAPVFIEAKLLVQNLWIEKYGWDDLLPQKYFYQWQDIVKKWQGEEFRLPRFIGARKNVVAKELHICADASKDAYGISAYLRQIYIDNQIDINLVFSKARIKPMHKASKKKVVDVVNDASESPKGLTIPLLELLALLCASRAARFLKKELKIEDLKIFIWSDSQVALSWVFSSKELKKFVENRVIEIRTHKKKLDLSIMYINTSDNSADIASRGMSFIELCANPNWWHGPSFLRTFDASWPQQPDLSLKTLDLSEEAMSFVVDASKCPQEINCFPIEKRTNSWFKLRRLFIYWLKFLKFKVFQKNSLERAPPKMQKIFEKVQIIPSVSVLEFQLAEKLLIKKAQIERPPDKSEIKCLGLYVDDNGIYRSRGRLQHSDLEEFAKFPIFIPRHHRLALILLEHFHLKNLHGGPAALLADLRSHFWLTKGRQMVRKIMKKCTTCNRFVGPAFKLPPMPALPKTRVQKCRPWTHSAVDFFGPVVLKMLDGETRKAWVSLFTCLNVRAIHFEIAIDNTAETFLNCLRRFIALCGLPSTMLSDNARGFKLVDETQFLAWDTISRDPKVLSYCAERGIAWSYIVEKAPWMGGIYEKMVHLTKIHLKKMIGKNFLSYDAFYTLLREVQAVLNSRPLTYSSDDRDNFQVLRPVDFFNPEMENGTPVLAEGLVDDEFLPNHDSRQKLLQLWRSGQRMLDKFWKSWHDDYLKSIRERHTDHKHSRLEIIRPPRIGEIVIIKEDLMPRGTWPLARVMEVLPGQRAARVLLPNRHILSRPINALFPLEVGDQEKEEYDEPGFEEPPTKGLIENASDSMQNQDLIQNKDSWPVSDIQRHSYVLRPKRRMAGMHLFIVTLIIFLQIQISLQKGSQVIPIQAKCWDRGVEIALAPNIRQIRVCSQPICLEKTHLSAHEFITFPKTVLLYHQNVYIHYWIGDSLTEDSASLNCEAQPACTLIDCYLCWEFIVNHDCFPWSVLALLAVIAYIGLSIVYTTLKTIISLLGRLYLASFCYKIWYAFSHLASRNHPPQDETAYLIHEVVVSPANVRRRNSIRTVLMGIRGLTPVVLSISCFFLLVVKVNSIDCSETTIFSAEVQACVQKEGNRTCTISASTIVTVPPHGQTSCFLIRDADGRPIGSLELKISEIEMKCHPVTHHYTRDFLVKTFSAKLCAAEGSCRSSRCADLKPHESVPELEALADKSGFNRCTESCGFLSCGCLTPTAGCIFFRTYVEETNDRSIHEVFRCAYWTSVVPINITITTSNATTSFYMPLAPGELFKPAEANGLHATLLNQIHPHVALLDAYFITNNSHTALLDDTHYDTTKLFQCAEVTQALQFKCRLDPNICNCLPAEKTISCLCKETSFAKAYSTSLLPLVQPGVTLRDEDGITAHFLQNTALEIQLNLMDYQLVELSDSTTCAIIPRSLKGCYRCSTGAEFVFECHADKPGALVHIVCPRGVEFYTTCDGSLQSKRLAFEKAYINASCTAVCSGGSTNFRIAGQLFYLPQVDIYNPNRSRYGVSISPGIDWLTIMENILEWLIRDWRKLVIIASVAFLAILVPCWLPSCLACHSIMKFKSH